MEFTVQIYSFKNCVSANFKRKIGILGGTFNPVHVGHIYMARRAYQEFSLDKVIFIPVGDPPHKRDIEVTDKEHRFTMVEIAVDGIEGMEVSRVEVERQGSTYTIDTLSALKQQSDDEFYYIIGTDTLFEITTWKRYEEVLKLTEFICFSRPGYETEKILRYLEFFREEYSKHIHMSEYRGIDVSSHEIRKRVKMGLSIKGLVPDDVETYIRENGLYIL
ncbi:MAG: nicotinate-nucleotide adenylyltransferase [Eubacteriales bacterium]